jgi:glutamate-ammonia-ligase adenylyltransferase
VTATLADRLADAVAGGPLAARLHAAAAPLLERRGGDAAARQLDGPVLRGLARAICTRPEWAGFLSRRPALLERLARADASELARRGRELEADPGERDASDLEAALDAMRLLRREETCVAACLDLGGALSFEATSVFLSQLAEAIARRALALARHALAATAPRVAVSAIGMGKIAGREFTYHSDLDLIFLYAGTPDEVVVASRIGQRMISYLTTLTGAGSAYAVDTRLRPSGEQGMLVTSYAAFDRYQCEEAQTWEHLAMLRARAIAGDVEPAQRVLDHVRAQVLARRRAPWPELAPLRRRVEVERARETEGSVAFKTGRGGLMDVDFLAGGALLERGARDFPALPSIPAMLACGVRGPRVDALVEDYRFLRLLEARTRWIAGRGVEELASAGEALAEVAELVAPTLAPEALLGRVAAVRERVRGAYDEVIAAGTVAALEAPPVPPRGGRP